MRAVIFLLFLPSLWGQSAVTTVGGNLDILQKSIVIEVPNSGTGTTLNKLAKIPANLATVLTTSAADQTAALGVVVGGAGATGNAQIGILGQFSCLFDNTATTAGHVIVPSGATAGTCHDAGTADITTVTGEVMGQVLSSNGACGSPPCGPYAVMFNTPDYTLPGAGGSTGSGGGTGNPNRQWSNLQPGTNANAGSFLAGNGVTLAATGTGVVNANQLGGVTSAANLVRVCEIVIGDPGASSPVLANDNDQPVVCANETGATMTITGVSCYANAGSPTVTPIITGGAANSILSAALTCGTGSFAAGSLQGTPTETNGQTIDGNITVAGGTAKYIVIRITRTL